ncbi:MAG: SDR family NAD(P)-dependent oxidoreductase [Gammaproteobacteria bacterium]|nr:SDR family NAD(P)-dependent oxidoreductase [Gammaproteobacteria bacterium]
MSRIVLITGCSTGIGRALAQAFIDNGDIVLATARKKASLKDLDCEHYALDVTDADSIAKLQKAVGKTYDKIDVLVNNAGVATMGPVATMPLDTLRQQLETNTIAPLALLQTFLPMMQESQAPMLVNIGSVSGILTTPFAGAYCASKRALHALGDALRMELAPLGIRVVTVQPGGVKSALGDNASAEVDSWLDEDNLYWPLRDDIIGRAKAQQDGATAADTFAEEVVVKLTDDKPEPIIRAGAKSTLLPALERWVPTERLDALLSKKFGLNKLKH